MVNFVKGSAIFNIDSFRRLNVRLLLIKIEAMSKKTEMILRSFTSSGIRKNFSAIPKNIYAHPMPKVLDTLSKSNILAILMRLMVDYISYINNDFNI